MTTQTMMLIGGLLVAAFFVGRFLFRADDKVEQRRKAAIDVSTTLSNLGLKRIPIFLKNYAVGDYSGMLSELGSLSEALKDPDQREEEFSRLLNGLLQRRLQNPETRKQLLEQIERIKLATDPNPVPADAAA